MYSQWSVVYDVVKYIFFGLFNLFWHNEVFFNGRLVELLWKKELDKETRSCSFFLLPMLMMLYPWSQIINVQSWGSYLVWLKINDSVFSKKKEKINDSGGCIRRQCQTRINSWNALRTRRLILCLIRCTTDYSSCVLRLQCERWFFGTYAHQRNLFATITPIS